MNELSIDVLLEFLYNQFAVTFILCIIGSFIREITRSMNKKNKDKESKMLDIKRIVTSTVFSTFLMCACAEYVDLPFSVYAIVSIICSMWGLAIINAVINVKFISIFLGKMSKRIADPLIKSAAESASEYLEAQEKEKEETETPTNKDDNETETPSNKDDSENKNE